MLQGSAGREIAAHAMNAAYSGSRGGAEIDVGIGGGITVPRWPEDCLAQRHSTAADITALKVGIHGFKHCRRRNGTRKDAVTKAGSKALYLCFDAAGHIDGRAVGNMTVCPGNMFAFRRSL